MNKRVVLLVDNKRRDLTGATLIAYQLRVLGIECMLEPLEAYRGCLAAHKPDMIIFNHLTGTHLVKYSRRLADLGVLVGVLPNEGINYNLDDLKFNAGKYHSGAHMDCFFCWNDQHKEALVENGFREGTRIEVIGPPRFDFYFEPWSRVMRIRKFFAESGRPCILICSNFVFSKYKDLPREEADRTFAPWRDRIPVYKDYWSAIEANYRARKSFFNFVESIVASDRYDVILRPHPNEDVRDHVRWYESLDAPGKAHVILDRESNIADLILACDLEVSCETCTTALESWIAGKPTVELVFERHPMYFHKDIAAMNVLCDDPKEISDVIARELENPAQPGFKEIRGIHLKKYCDSPRGNSSHRCAATIASLLEGDGRVDWNRLDLVERRRGAKLNVLRHFDLPYNFDPLLFVKKRLFQKRYANKDHIAKKTIGPKDVAEAMAFLERKLAGAGR